MYTCVGIYVEFKLRLLLVKLKGIYLMFEEQGSNDAKEYESLGK